MAYEASYKVAMLGAGGVGKTCMLLRLVQDRFDTEYIPTIQDYFDKDIKVDGKSYQLKLIDTAGQDDMTAITNIGIGDAQAFVLVFSVVSKLTLNELQKFRDMIPTPSDGTNPKVILCGNKCDMPDRVITKAEGEAMMKTVKASHYFETSAKEGVGIEASFQQVVRLLTGSKSGKGGNSEEAGCCEVA